MKLHSAKFLRVIGISCLFAINATVEAEVRLFEVDAAKTILSGTAVAVGVVNADPQVAGTSDVTKFSGNVLINFTSTEAQIVGGSLNAQTSGNYFPGATSSSTMVAEAANFGFIADLDKHFFPQSKDIYSSVSNLSLSLSSSKFPYTFDSGVIDGRLVTANLTSGSVLQMSVLRTNASRIPTQSLVGASSTNSARNAMLVNGDTQLLIPLSLSFDKGYGTFNLLLSGQVLAKQKELNYVLGDADRNGCIDGGDYLLLMQTLSSNVTPGFGADANFDGKINSGDLIILKLNYGACK